MKIPMRQREVEFLPYIPEQLKVSRDAKRSGSIWVIFSQRGLFAMVAQKNVQYVCGEREVSG